MYHDARAMNNIIVNNRVREWRQVRGISQTGLSAKSGVPLATLNRIERWHFRVSRQTAERLALALECKVVEVFPSLGEVQR